MENMYTKDDLKTMQSWSLERKIQVSQTRIMEFYNRYFGMVTVSISGGKDSMVLLDLARRVHPEIEAVYVNTGLDYPEVRRLAMETENVTVLKPSLPFDEVIEKYGWCFPSKDVAQKIHYARLGAEWALRGLRGENLDGTPNAWRQRYKRWAHLVDAPFKISHECCRIMKEGPLNAYTRKIGKHPIIGLLADESHLRQQAWLKVGCNNFDGRQPLSKPISFWTTQDILQYTKQVGLPLASVYGEIVTNRKGELMLTGEQRTGCVFCPIGCHLDKVNSFQRLAYTHPKLHSYCIKDLKLGELLDYLKVRY